MRIRIVLALLLLVPAMAHGATGASTPEPGADAAYELVPVVERESLVFRHVHFEQRVEGLPVLDAYVTEHVATGAHPLVVRHEALADVDARSGAFRLTHAQVLASAEAHLHVRALDPWQAPHVRAAWAQTPGGLRAAYEVVVTATDPLGIWRVVVDAESGRILEAAQTASFATGAAAGSASSVRALALPAPSTVPAGAGIDAPARVFRVNPIVALADASLRDNAASIEDASLADAILEVTLTDLGAGSLGTPRVWIADAVAQAYPRADLRADRADPRFVETMILHYLEMALARLDEAGYGDLLDYRILVRAHQPMVVPDAMAGNGMITFGYRTLNTVSQRTAGMASSGEDAELVIHELGHLVHTAASPAPHQGWRWAWGEGFGDWLAAVVLEPESEGFGDPCVFEWLSIYYAGGNVQYGDLECSRVLDNDLQYPEDLEWDPSRYSGAHKASQFWSGSIWDVHRVIGANESIPLVMEALHLTPRTLEGFEDMGVTVLLADFALTGGAREELIRDSFARRALAIPSLEDLAEAGIVTLPAVPPEPVTTNDIEETVPGLPGLLTIVAAALLAVAFARRRA